MTTDAFMECRAIIQAMKEDTHTNKNELFDVISMIVDSEDIYQSIKDYAKEMELDYESN